MYNAISVEAVRVSPLSSFAWSSNQISSNCAQFMNMLLVTTVKLLSFHKSVFTAWFVGASDKFTSAGEFAGTAGKLLGHAQAKNYCIPTFSASFIAPELHSHFFILHILLSRLGIFGQLMKTWEDHLNISRFTGCLSQYGCDGTEPLENTEPASPPPPSFGIDSSTTGGGRASFPLDRGQEVLPLLTYLSKK